MLFGLFLGTFVRALFRPAFPLQKFWLGSLALLALSIGYCLPVYERDISQLLRSSGISSVTISVAEIKLEADLAGKGSQGTNSASGGASGLPAQSVVRFTDPRPGLALLEFDFGEVHPIIDRDIDYMQFLGGWDVAFGLPAAQKIRSNFRQFFTPITLLSKCLGSYRDDIQDSQFMLIDIKGSISPLFMMHKVFKDAIDPIIDNGRRLRSHEPALTEYGGYFYQALVKEARSTISSVIANYSSVHLPPPSDCEDANAVLKEVDLSPTTLTLLPTITVFQPYSTIALADLLLAHGAPDEAASVLAEWLWRWEQLSSLRDDAIKGGPAGAQLPSKDGRVTELTEALSMPEWYRIEVLAKLQAILSELAGQNNRSFRDILDHYKTVFANYVGGSRYTFHLEDIAEKCGGWDKQFGNGDIARQIAYILLGTEIDSLRTSLNFIDEMVTIEGLESLRSRATVIAGMHPDCLPRKEPYNDDFRKAVIAEGRVISGVLGIAVGGRMSMLAASPNDRNRAESARRIGENVLIGGWADLQPIWRSEAEGDRTKEWADRIFRASQWDKSANLAMRVLSRLRRGE
jgi:hypothetical protein